MGEGDRELVAKKGVETDILQADGIDHAGRGLSSPVSGRVAGPRLPGDRLEDQRAELSVVRKARELVPVAEHTGGDHHRVLHGEGSDADGEVGAGHGSRRSQSISDASKIGPSRHTVA